MHPSAPELTHYDPRQRLLAAALEATTNPMLITDRDGIILWVNDAFVDLTGYSRKELVGNTPRMLKSGLLDEGFYQHMWQTLLAGQTWRSEFVNRRKDGSLYQAEETITPVRTTGGPISHFIASVMDLTAHKAHEQEITRLNRLYTVLSKVNHAVLHTSTQEELLDRVCHTAVEYGGFALAWIGWHDPSTRTIRPVARAGIAASILDQVVMSSDAAHTSGQSFTAIAVREGRPVTVKDIPHDEPSHRWREQAMQHGLRGGGAFPIRSHGKVCGVLSVSAGDSDEFAEEEVRLLSEVADDVSFALDHLAAETHRQQIEQEHRHLATIVAVSDDAIVSRRLDGTILTWNRGAELIYGYTEAETVGQSHDLLIPATRLAEVRELEARLRAGGSVPTFETVRRRRDGREIEVALTVSALRDEQGRMVGIATISRDITEQKSVAAQLLRAQRLESVGELAGGIAHDLNNILAPIRLGLSLLRSEESGKHAHDLLDVLEASVTRGAQIIRQILSFSRGADGGKSALQTLHLVRELAKIFEQTLPKSIRVEAQFPRDLWPVLGDATQLHQVFMNLCVNARDAMPHGGTLTLIGENLELDADAAAAHPDARPGPYVVWAVTDTGVGIPPKNLKRIFEPFFTTKELSKGTGLGLSTVAKIVRLHGGFVEVVSEIGRGTSFRVHLPAVSLEEQKPGSRAPMLPCGRGELVLLVDDEYSIRQMAQHVLQAHNYRVVTADSGTEAQAAFRVHSDQIAVLLTDLAMPGMKGTDLIQLLRGLNPRLKVIAMTGELDYSQHGASAAEIVADALLRKPFAVDHLLTTIADVLERHSTPHN